MGAQHPEPVAVGLRQQLAQQGDEHGDPGIHHQRHVAAVDQPAGQHLGEGEVAEHVRGRGDRQHQHREPRRALQDRPEVAAQVGDIDLARAPGQPRHQAQREHGQAEVVPAVQEQVAEQQEGEAVEQIQRAGHVRPRSEELLAVRRQQAQQRHQRHQHRELVDQQRGIGLEHQHRQHRQQQPGRERTCQHAGRGGIGGGMALPAPAARAPPQPQHHRQQEDLEQVQRPLVAEVGRAVLAQERELDVERQARTVQGVLAAFLLCFQGPQRRRIDPPQPAVAVGDRRGHRLLPGANLRIHRIRAPPQRQLPLQRRRQPVVGVLQQGGDPGRAFHQRLRDPILRQRLPGQVPVCAPPRQLGRGIGIGLAGLA